MKPSSTIQRFNIILASLFMALMTNTSFSQNYTTMSAGNWNDPSIWSTDGGVSSCGCLPPHPTIGANITINHAVTMTQHLGISGGSSFVVNLSGSLFGPSYNLGVWGSTTLVDLYGVCTFQKFLNGFSSGDHGATINSYTTIEVPSRVQLFDGDVNIDFGYLYLPSGNFDVHPNAEINLLNGSKIELFGGNISNEGNMFICNTCCVTTAGNWSNDPSGIISGSGSMTSTGGNMSNDGIISPTLTWCSAGSDTGMPSAEDCITSTATCNVVMLPIELTLFEGSLNSDVIELRWITASEFNNDYFILLRSYDGFNWEELATIESAGNSLEEQYYSYSDDRYYGEIVYYKLQQVDLDGTFRDSSPISISTMKSANSISCYPNPASDWLFIKGEVKTISMRSFDGREINCHVQNNAINISTLPNGTYQLFMEGTTGEWTAEKIIVLH